MKADKLNFTVAVNWWKNNGRGGERDFLEGTGHERFIKKRKASTSQINILCVKESQPTRKRFKKVC